MVGKQENNKIFIDETTGESKTQEQLESIERAKLIFNTIKTTDCFIVKVTDDDIIVEMA